MKQGSAPASGAEGRPPQTGASAAGAIQGGGASGNVSKPSDSERWEAESRRAEEIKERDDGEKLADELLALLAIS